MSFQVQPLIFISKQAVFPRIFQASFWHLIGNPACLDKIRQITLVICNIKSETSETHQYQQNQIRCRAA